MASERRESAMDASTPMKTTRPTIAAIFFISSMVALHYGRLLGLRYREREKTENLGGLATVEVAIFGLMGLLLAFTISGALQRFDDRRQLVLQEATAVATAYDRLGLFEGDVAREFGVRVPQHTDAHGAQREARQE
jgi:hypothetical protein